MESNFIANAPDMLLYSRDRHGPGAHLVLLSGSGGYSLVWTKEDRSDMIKWAPPRRPRRRLT